MVSQESELRRERLLKTPQIGVIGPGESNLPKDLKVRIKMLGDAEELGREIAKAGAVLITGGTDGLMEVVSKGSYEAGGITVGTPGRARGSSNSYIKVEICTPIDVGDFLFAGILSCDSIIVFPGGAGTMAELALAYRSLRPMIIMQGYNGWYDSLVGTTLDLSSGKLSFVGAATPKKAVEIALQEAGKHIT